MSGMVTPVPTLLEKANLNEIPDSSDLSSWSPFNEDDNRSLINIIPREIRARVLEVPKEFLIMTETELKNILTPDPFICRVRLAFWAEYERAQAHVDRMDLHRIAQMIGTVSKHVLSQFRRSENVAYILNPPASYEMYLEEALMCGMRRMREEILEMPIKRPDGSIDHKAAELLLKAIAFIDMRKHGGILQRSVQVTSHQGFKKITNDLTLKEINERIAELEQQGTVELAQEAVRIPEVVE